MSILFWLILLMAAYGLRIRKTGFCEDYIDQPNIQPIKGIFLLLVFISHFVSYVSLRGVWDVPYFEIRQFLGQLVVAPFLFYSGFGVAESIQKRGYAYIKRMPLHRIGRVLVQFSAAVLLFLVLQLALGNRYGIRKILLSLIGVESLGNSNWYIFCMLCMYAATWMAFFLFRKGKLLPLLFVTAMTVGYIVAMKKLGMGSWWYNTAAVYVAGMWFSYFRKPLEKIVFSHWAVYSLFLLISVAAFLFLYKHRSNLICYQLHSIVFALIIVLMTCKLQIQNRALAYCGEHLFSLFILQRLPMIALDNTPIEKFPAVYFLVCMVVTVGLSWVFDKGMDKLWKLVIGAGKSSQSKP